MAASSPLLDLPQVELVVAWTSLPLLDLRLKELVLLRSLVTTEGEQR